jgi:hypothetical protein
MKYFIAIMLAIGCSVIATLLAKIFGNESAFTGGAIGGGVGALASVVYIMYVDKKTKGKV